MDSKDGVPWGLIVAMIVIVGLGALFASLVAEGDATSAEDIGLGARAEQLAGSATPADLEAGRELFFANACNACHGNQLEGGFGPALPGHTAAAVVRQLRRPLFQMPLFTAVELPDDDLILLAAFIASLEPDADHDQHDEAGDAPTPLNLRDEITMHHWMALSALGTGGGDEALRHIGEVIELVSGEHAAAMRAAAEAIEEGRVADAEASIAEMLAGFVPELSATEIRLRLALQAIATHDTADATASLERFLASASDDPRAAEVTEILARLAAGDLEAAEGLLTPLTGLAVAEAEHDKESAEHADAEDDDHDATDSEDHAE